MSAKTSSQPGRRTPLSLSGAVTKTHPNKGGNNAANGGGNNNANGHNASNSNKQDNNKQQQSKTEQQPQTQNNNTDTKENPTKKQQQADKKQQQQQNEINKKSNEKNQNGVNNNKQQTQANENKQQQQQYKDKQQQNGNDNNKTNEKDNKKEKVDKTDKQEKQDKPEKETKVKEDKKVEQIEKTDSKKEEKKTKEVKEVNNKEDKKEAKEDKKDVKEDKKEVKEDKKAEEKIEKSQAKKDEKKTNEGNQNKIVEEKKPEEKLETMEVVEEQQQKSPPVTPKTNSKANKTSTPVSKTPTKASEKTPQKTTPSNNQVKTTPVTKRQVTTAVDDEDDADDNDIEMMEPLAIESSPIKPTQRDEVAHINIAPSATSTPGKILTSKRNIAAPKTDVQLAMQTGLSPERPRVFSQISGRKSIRPISDYTPSKFQTNTQFRECYRRINTELDVTNTSMNVTVGSEVPSNLSFSFFGRGRKRDRTPPQQHSQSAIGELQTDMEVSPPKRARLDMQGFFSAVSSPLSLLRNRFSKATLQSSTPVKLQEKLNSSEDEIEVQNVSGVSVHEEIAKTEKELKTNEDNNDATLAEEAKETKLTEDIKTPTAVEGESKDNEFTNVSLKSEKTCAMEHTSEQQSDIKITETPLQTAVGDPMAKNKRCIVM